MRRRELVADLQVVTIFSAQSAQIHPAECNACLPRNDDPLAPKPPYFRSLDLQFRRAKGSILGQGSCMNVSHDLRIGIQHGQEGFIAGAEIAQIQAQSRQFGKLSLSHRSTLLFNNDRDVPGGQSNRLTVADGVLRQEVRTRSMRIPEWLILAREIEIIVQHLPARVAPVPNFQCGRQLLVWARDTGALQHIANDLAL
jgi:hypothetical protein